MIQQFVWLFHNLYIGYKPLLLTLFLFQIFQEQFIIIFYSVNLKKINQIMNQSPSNFEEIPSSFEITQIQSNFTNKFQQSFQSQDSTMHQQPSLEQCQCIKTISSLTNELQKILNTIDNMQEIQQTAKFKIFFNTFVMEQYDSILILSKNYLEISAKYRAEKKKLNSCLICDKLHMQDFTELLQRVKKCISTKFSTCVDLSNKNEQISMQQLKTEAELFKCSMLNGKILQMKVYLATMNIKYQGVKEINTQREVGRKEMMHFQLLYKDFNQYLTLNDISDPQLDEVKLQFQRLRVMHHENELRFQAVISQKIK